MRTAVAKGTERNKEAAVAIRPTIVAIDRKPNALRYCSAYIHLLRVVFLGKRLLAQC
jgi:hypothetical protein